MTTGLLEKPTFLPDRPILDGGGTLEELLSSALREARANGSTECPICAARMSFARAGAPEAECGACGSRLS
jgi:transcription initiation factor IIE alpha subunit